MTRQVNGPSRADLWRNARGYIAETGGIGMDTGTVVSPTSGIAYFQQVYLFKGEIISNIDMVVGTAPVALTLAQVAMWDTITGALLASSVDQSAAWATIGRKTNPLQVAFQAPSEGVYYVGHLAVWTTTGPGLTAGTAAAAANRIAETQPHGARPILFGGQAGLAALPNPLTIAAGAAPTTWYYGLS